MFGSVSFMLAGLSEVLCVDLFDIFIIRGGPHYWIAIKFSYVNNG